jgi:hypothetical protein
MSKTVGQPASAGRVVNFPSPQSRQSLTVRELADAYMAVYAGRDNSRPARVQWWCDRLGAVRVVDLDSDLIADHLDLYAAEPARSYKGRDEDGLPILGERGQRKPATINRMKSTLGAMLTFAKQRRLTPRGWANPIRDVPGQR